MSTAADPHVLGPGLAPTPFTADEIRDGCPAGRTIRLLVEDEGEPARIRFNRFVAVDDDGAVVERSFLEPDGTVVVIDEARTTWHELQAHASFPESQTRIDPDRIETELGLLDCLRYTVTDGTSVDTFWFAASAAGMPVRYRTEIDGRVTSTVTMVANELPG